MKKLLLFIGILSLPMVQNINAQSLTFDALPETAELGSAANFTLSYTSDIPVKVGVDLFVFDVDGSGNLTQDWSTWKAGISTDVLPAAGTASAQNITLSIPGNLELSSALASGKTYVWSLTLKNEAGDWITGSQHATTLIAAGTVVNGVHFEGTTAAEVNAGTTVTVAYNYTMLNDGIVKIALSKYSATESWINDVASFIVNPAMATTATPVMATADIVIPADAIPSVELTNGEMYKWEVSIFSPDWASYLSGVKTGVVVNAPLAGLSKNATKAFSIYPNPASGTLHLVGTNVEQVQVYSVSGKMLINAGVTNSLDVSSLAVGLYFIRINNTNVLKFIKN